MWAWRVGTLLGVPLKIHVTFPLVLLWALFSYGGLREGERALFGLFVTLLLFVCVLLHELGHAIAAQRLGAVVEDITLLPIGGVARFRPMNDRPRDELLISLAGPLVNLTLVGLIFAALPLLSALSPWRAVGDGGVRSAVAMLAAGLGEVSAWGVISYLFFTNLLLALFNLLPAFPLDGGRVLRALMAMVLPYGLATTVTVRLGQLAALLLIFLGMRIDFSLGLVGLFMLMGGSPELRRLALRQTLERGQVGSFLTRPYTILRPEMTVADAHQALLADGLSALPVASGGRVVGLLHGNDLQRQPASVPVGEVMGPIEPNFTLGQSLYDAQLALFHAERYVGAVIEEDQFLGLLTQADIDRGYTMLEQRQRARAAWRRGA